MAACAFKWEGPGPVWAESASSARESSLVAVAGDAAAAGGFGSAAESCWAGGDLDSVPDMIGDFLAGGGFGCGVTRRQTRR